jgi:hypothetical protein
MQETVGRIERTVGRTLMLTSNHLSSGLAQNGTPEER